MTNRFLVIAKGDVELSEWIAGWYRLYEFDDRINQDAEQTNQETADLRNATQRLCKMRLNNGLWRAE